MTGYAILGLMGCAWALVAIVFDYFDRPKRTAGKWRYW